MEREFACANVLQAYRYAYSMSPTYIMLISGLGNDKKCHFSHKVIIDDAES